MTFLVLYPNDWRVVVRRDGQLVGVAPASIADNRRSLEHWVATREVPPGTPELRRVVRVTDAPAPAHDCAAQDDARARMRAR